MKIHITENESVAFEVNLRVDYLFLANLKHVVVLGHALMDSTPQLKEHKNQFLKERLLRMPLRGDKWNVWLEEENMIRDVSLVMFSMCANR